MTLIKQNISKKLGGIVRTCIKNCDNISFLRWYFRHAKRLKIFKNKHLGKDCFIIGNGPSLNHMDLVPLNNYYTFGLNKIYLIFDRVDLNLTYHVAVNRYVIQQSASVFEKFSHPTFLSYKASVRTIKPHSHIYYIFTGGERTFRKHLYQEVWEGFTVTYVALQIAFFMGFKRVFLIGVDHNYRAEGQPKEKQYLRTDDINHFDPSYFKNNEWQLPELEGSELAYHMALFSYKEHDRQIYDATINGKLKIFPKITYDEALDMCKEKI